MKVGTKIRYVSPNSDSKYNHNLGVVVSGDGLEGWLASKYKQGHIPFKFYDPQLNKSTGTPYVVDPQYLELYMDPNDPT